VLAGNDASDQAAVTGGSASIKNGSKTVRYLTRTIKARA